MLKERGELKLPLPPVVHRRSNFPVLSLYTAEAEPRQILLDTDVDTDDFFALFFLLKLNRSEFHLEGITINTNAWTDAGHAVNQIYDILYMMDRDDILVGLGGEGGSWNTIPYNQILADIFCGKISVPLFFNGGLYFSFFQGFPVFNSPLSFNMMMTMAEGKGRDGGIARSREQKKKGVEAKGGMKGKKMMNNSEGKKKGSKLMMWYAQSANDRDLTFP
ncbi:hypothetical protein GOBAR_DD12424 [Gossypium barbadense]|nr:hypothetical protein GOBAR_DD12424 [Gossypium barbadense]